MANVLQMLASLLGGGQQDQTNMLAAAGQPLGMRQSDRIDSAPPFAMPRQAAAPMPSAAPAVDSMQTGATAAPAPAPAQSGGIGGFIQQVFGGGEQKGYNETVQWLQRKGYDPGQAMMIAKDRPTLQKVLLSAGGQDDYTQRATAALKLGLKQNDPAFKEYVLTGKLPEPNSDEWISAGQGRVFNKRTGEFKTSPDRGTDAPTVQTFFDEKTGQEYKAQWDTQKGAWVPVGGQKIPKDGITVTSPDGTTMTIGGNGAGQKLTEGQSKDVVYYTRGIDANKSLEGVESQLTDLKQTATKWIPLGLGNYLQNPEFQKAKQAADSFLTAILRKDTGAAITSQEFDIYGPMFLPIPGDSPQVIQQKSRARQVALLAIRSGLGTAEAVAEANKIKLGVDETPIAPSGKSKVIDGYTIEEVPE